MLGRRDRGVGFLGRRGRVVKTGYGMKDEAEAEAVTWLWE